MPRAWQLIVPAKIERGQRDDAGDMKSGLAVELACLVVLGLGCASFAHPTCEASKSLHVYQAADLHEQWVNFLWVEIPDSDGAGTFPGRLFVASGDPFGTIVPSMIDLPCQLSSGTQAADLVPAPVEIEFDGAGNLKTSYAWRSCSKCSECYMVWDFELDLQGHKTEEALIADVVLNETFHQHPMQILSLKMPEVTDACTQPHMSCRAGGACSAVRFQVQP